MNKLFENVIWGQKGNFLDVPTDCPQRDERMGWTGDIQVFAPAASGIFDCAGCALPLYSSKTKFDSGTGWPSFWAPLPGAVAYSTDWETGYPRKEVHCTRCGGHLGHVFDDGPKPTGKRYCMNGDALLFRPG